MAGKKLFKMRFLGYGKQDVCNYLDKLNGQLKEELREKDEQIAMLTSTNADFAEANAGLKKSINVHKKAEEIISQAKKEAERIIAEAQATAAARQTDLQKKIQKEKASLRVIQAEVAGLKKLAANAIGKFSNELESLEA
ncbi:MAG: DivIVA domain-containing protein [Clostridiales bacterium]|jgi:cell division septum initiation protein DivIVA|nr:DivIVA domain-containing protein [Clostridiales bacterium]